MSSVTDEQIMEFLRAVNYPADKRHMVDCALKLDVDKSLLWIVENMPEKKYNNPREANQDIHMLDLIDKAPAFSG